MAPTAYIVVLCPCTLAYASGSERLRGLGNRSKSSGRSRCCTLAMNTALSAVWCGQILRQMSPATPSSQEAAETAFLPPQLIYLPKGFRFFLRLPSLGTGDG